MKNKKIILAGGSGFIGSFLCAYFADNNEIVVLTRGGSGKDNNRYMQKPLLLPNVRYVIWDGERLGQWAQELEGADLLINLAGKSVNCRYDYRNMKAIFDSRLKSTAVLADAVAQCRRPPLLWVNIASATIYRHSLDRPQDEANGEISVLKAMNGPSLTMADMKAAVYRVTKWLVPSLFVPNRKKLKKDFSVRVCQEWEKSFYALPLPGTRKVCLRTAVTLGRGGVMMPYLNLVKFGLGGRHGNGKQLFSWVHVEDLCRVIDWLDNNDEQGTFNCAAPAPVSNRAFMAALRSATGHKLGLPAFKWMLEIGARMIGTEPELLLKSRWVVPTRLLQKGFVFKFGTLPLAFQDILQQLPRNRYHLF